MPELVSTSAPAIAAIVISYGNRPTLVDAVRSLYRQDIPAEIVVVHSGSERCPKGARKVPATTKGASHQVDYTTPHDLFPLISSPSDYPYRGVSVLKYGFLGLKEVLVGISSISGQGLPVGFVPHFPST